MRRLTRCMALILLCILIFSLISGVTAQDKHYTAENGVLDLRGFDMEKDGKILLNGEWALYWEKLLNYQELKFVKPDLYGAVPNNWERYTIDGANLPAEGYATYRLHIKTDLPEGSLMGVRIKSVSSAYHLFINDQLIGSVGTVGVTEEAESGRYIPRAMSFAIPDSEFDIIMQVSNHQYHRGGLWYGIYFGSAEAIQKFNNISYANQIFINGATTILVIFNLIIFFVSRELKYPLYLAIFLALLGICSDMFGQLTLQQFYPLRAQEIIFIFHTVVLWTLFSFLVFLHELYRSRFSRWTLRIFLVIFAALQLSYIVIDSIFYTKATEATIVICLAASVCIIIIAAIGVRNGKKDGWFHIVGSSILVSAYLHDILYWSQIIKNNCMEFVYLGMLVFIIIQITVLALRIKQYSEEKNAAELIFLQAQIKPHFLYNALNTIVSVSRYDTDQARELLLNLSNYLRRSFDFKDLSQTVPLKHEIELAQAYINIEKSRFQERLTVNFNVCDEMGIRVPILVLQPIIENAVNHGVLPKQEGGRIDITVSRDGNNLTFSVKDDGVGTENVYINRYNLKRKYGSGIGLANVNLRLIRLYGRGLQMISKPGIGTEVKWTIPINRKGRYNEKKSNPD